MVVAQPTTVIRRFLTPARKAKKTHTEIDRPYFGKNIFLIRIKEIIYTTVNIDMRSTFKNQKKLIIEMLSIIIKLVSRLTKYNESQ